MTKVAIPVLASSVAAAASIGGDATSVLFIGGSVGGGSIFTWSASGPADNVLTFPALTGFWVRQWDKTRLNVQWAGAVGDYNPNTLTGTDDTAAINAAIAALPGAANSGGTVFFPGPNWYRCDSPINAFYDAGAVSTARKSAIILEGNSHVSYGQVNVQGARLVYTGVGARFIDGRSGVVKIRNLAIYYNNTSWRHILDLRMVAASNVVTAASAPFVVGDVGKGISAFGLPPRTTITGFTNASTVTISANAWLTRGRTITDGVTTSGSKTITSATAAFTRLVDEGAQITGAGMPTDEFINIVSNGTTALLNANASATAAGVTLNIGEQPAVIGGFQGALVDFTWYPSSVGGANSGDSNGGQLEGCTLGGYAAAGVPRPTSADCGINWGNAIFGKAEDCVFLGMRYGIRGCGWLMDGSLGTTYYSNGIKLKNNNFAYCWGAAHINPAQGWTIDTCGFEGLRAETAYDTPINNGMVRAVYSDTGGQSVYGLLVTGGWFGDAANSSGPVVWFCNGPQTWLGCVIQGAQLGATSAFCSVRLEAQVNGLMVMGNAISTNRGLDVVGTGRHEGVWFMGNDLSNCVTPYTNANVAPGVIVMGNFDQTRETNPASVWGGGIGRLQSYNFSGGTTPLLATVNSAGVDQVGFDPQGLLKFFDAALSAATATAGAAGAPPAQVVGYFIVKDSAGTSRKIPYYAT